MKREVVNHIIAEAREAYILGAKQAPDDEGLAYAVRATIARTEQLAARHFDPYEAVIDELQSRRASVIRAIDCLESVRPSLSRDVVFVRAFNEASFISADHVGSPAHD